MQRTAASPILASPHSTKIAGADYRYGALTYQARGELENLYFPNAKTPYQHMMEEWESLDPEEQEDQLSRLTPEERAHRQKGLDSLRRGSERWQHNVEDLDAFLYFTSSDERWGSFLSGALPRFNPFNVPPDWQHRASQCTKGQRDEMFCVCLEVGPYAPKSFPRP